MPRFWDRDVQCQVTLDSVAHNLKIKVLIFPFTSLRISLIVKKRFGLPMLARLKKPDGNIKLVDNVAEMREIHETMKEMKADLPRASKLQSDFNKHKVEEVMSVFGEVRELEELLGEFPGLDD